MTDKHLYPGVIDVWFVVVVVSPIVVYVRDGDRRSCGCLSSSVWMFDLRP